MSANNPQTVKANSFEFTNKAHHFIVCTDQGFRVHETTTCALKLNCTSIKGGLTICQSYGNSNIFFMVGTGENADLPTNKMCVWDDQTKQIVAEV